MEGFGEKSYNNLIDALEKAKDTDLVRVIYGLGIDNVGLSTARLIVNKLNNDPEAVLNATAAELTDIDGIGEVIAEAFVEYFKNEDKKDEYLDILSEVNIKEAEKCTDNRGTCWQDICYNRKC